MTWALAAWSFLKRMPWQVWAVAGLLLAAWLWGNHRYSQGIHTERARWEAAAQKAKDRAREADVDAANTRAVDEKENTDASNERKEGIRDAGRDGLNCARLRRAYPNRSIPACD